MYENRESKWDPGVALELFKTGEDKCLKSLTNIFNILFKDKLPEQWVLNLLVPILKGKQNPLNPNCYMGIKLAGHDFKLYEFLDGHLREMVDIDKMQYGYDRMPREVICFALRQKGVPEYLVNGVMSLYKGCKTTVSVDGELSNSFSVKAGVHQGSALNPLLFIMVMDVLIEGVRDGSLMELLYVDNLVLCGESLNEVIDKYG